MAYRIINFKFLNNDHLSFIQKHYQDTLDLEKIKTLTSVYVLKNFVRSWTNPVLKQDQVLYGYLKEILIYEYFYGNCIDIRGILAECLKTLTQHPLWDSLI